jgi:hypothetical protein
VVKNVFEILRQGKWTAEALLKACDRAEMN